MWTGRIKNEFVRKSSGKKIKVQIYISVLNYLDTLKTIIFNFALNLITHRKMSKYIQVKESRTHFFSILYEKSFLSPNPKISLFVFLFKCMDEWVQSIFFNKRKFMFMQANFSIPPFSIMLYCLNDGCYISILRDILSSSSLLGTIIFK